MCLTHHWKASMSVPSASWPYALPYKLHAAIASARSAYITASGLLHILMLYLLYFPDTEQKYEICMYCYSASCLNMTASHFNQVCRLLDD